jgi:hypothetical protein
MTLYEDRRRRMEAQGLAFTQPPPSRVASGRQLSIAETLPQQRLKRPVPVGIATDIGK